MIINGRKIAQAMKQEQKARMSARTKSLTLAVVYVGDDAMIENFIGIKRNFGEAIGARLEVKKIHKDAQESEVIMMIEQLNDSDRTDGIIVQLPLPKKFERQKILDTVDVSKDIDVLSRKTFEAFRESSPAEALLGGVLVSPVVRAIAKVLEDAKVDVREKRVLVVGRGALVGKPAIAWFQKMGADVVSVEKGDRIEKYSHEADIIISGAGSPGLIQKHMIKDGVVLIDAGTSEAAGEIAGDAAPDCAEKCSVFTPVPGGLGPITVACLFENLLMVSTK